MLESQIARIALQLSLAEREVQATIDLLDSGASLPFIARYRKEATGNLDEVAIARIRDLLLRIRQLDERREAILHSLSKRNLLTEDLREKLLAADTLTRLEDIYLPFRPKRKTRATAAKDVAWSSWPRRYLLRIVATWTRKRRLLLLSILRRASAPQRKPWPEHGTLWPSG